MKDSIVNPILDFNSDSIFNSNVDTILDFNIDLTFESDVSPIFPSENELLLFGNGLATKW